jgi:anion-transporting  ArsA/GET3 family ATPase
MGPWQIETIAASGTDLGRFRPLRVHRRGYTGRDGCEETGRLIERLRPLGVDCRWTVANMVVHSGACPFCEAIRNQQQQHLAELTRLAGDNADAGVVVPVPLFPYEIRTVDRLAEVAGILYGADAP